MTDLVIERFGVLNDSYTNAAMQHGTETEPFARHEYAVKNNVMVDEVDFVDHPRIAMAGASPDGLVTDGLVEIKCANSKTHFEYLLANEVPAKYKPQMAWQCCCTERSWCDFVSFDPRVPEGLQYFQIRYFPEHEYMNYLEEEVKIFLKEVDEKYHQLFAKLNELKVAA